MQILRHRSESNEWELVRARPDPRLRDQIHRGYNGWIENAATVVRRPEVAKTFIPVILNWGPAFGIRSPGNACGAMAPFGSFVGGPHDTHVMTSAGPLLLPAGQFHAARGLSVPGHGHA